MSSASIIPADSQPVVQWKIASNRWSVKPIPEAGDSSAPSNISDPVKASPARVAQVEAAAENDVDYAPLTGLSGIC